MTGRFLCIGEAMVELAPTGASDMLRLGFAGDTLNTAWYMRALRPDLEIGYFTRTGDDAMSDQFFHLMADAGIGAEHVQRMRDRTLGLYMIMLQEGERSFAYWRDQSAARCLADDRDALVHAVADHEVIYFSGITIAILPEAGRETLLSVLAEARADGKTIAFDPNLRARLWRSAEEMRDWVTRAAQVSDILLPSFEDEETHFGDANIDATIARYQGTGARLVVVKDGEGPVRYWQDGEAGEVAPQIVPKLIDTTAAGDSFNAGFLASADTGLSLAARIDGAAKVAAQVVQGKGALVPIETQGIAISA